MSENKRKVHSPEFKAKVGLEALKGLKTVNGRRPSRRMPNSFSKASAVQNQQWSISSQSVSIVRLAG